MAYINCGVCLECLAWAILLAIANVLAWQFDRSAALYHKPDTIRAMSHNQRELLEEDSENPRPAPEQQRDQDRIWKLELEVARLKGYLNVCRASLEKSKSSERTVRNGVEVLTAKVAKAQAAADDERADLLDQIGGMKSLIAYLDDDNATTRRNLQVTQTVLAQTLIRERHQLCNAQLHHQELRILKAESAHQDRMILCVEAAATELSRKLTEKVRLVSKVETALTGLGRELAERERRIHDLEVQINALKRDPEDTVGKDSAIRGRLSRTKDSLEQDLDRENQLSALLASATSEEATLDSELERLKGALILKENLVRSEGVTVGRESDDGYDRIEGGDDGSEAEVIESDAGDREEETDTEMEDFDEDEMSELIHAEE